MPISEHYIGLAVAVAAVVVTLAVAWKRWVSNHPPYPPGPKGHPILGNVFDLPESPIWEGFSRMSREYGEQRAASKLALARV